MSILTYLSTQIPQSMVNWKLELNPSFFFFFLRLRGNYGVKFVRFWGIKRMGLKWVVLGLISFISA